jgi:hypothetical protein
MSPPIDINKLFDTTKKKRNQLVIRYEVTKQNSRTSTAWFFDYRYARGVGASICKRGVTTQLLLPPESLTRVLFVQAAWVLAGQDSRTGTATGSKPGSKPPRNGCTTTCWRSRSSTSSRASPGPFSTRSATSNACGQLQRHPDLAEPGTVLGPHTRPSRVS